MLSFFSLYYQILIVNAKKDVTGKKNVSKKIIQNLHFVGVDILNKTNKEICK